MFNCIYSLLPPPPKTNKKTNLIHFYKKVETFDVVLHFACISHFIVCPCYPTPNDQIV